MLKKLASCALLAGIVVLGLADVAFAQRRPPAVTTRSATRQTFNFTFGKFFPRPELDRVPDDVLVGNLGFPQFLEYEIEDFRSWNFGVEWLFPVGSFVEIGPSISFSSRTVPTVYGQLLDEDLNEIEQDLNLRVIPISFTARVIPVPPSSPVQPYIGGGFAWLNWRYRESGSFVQFADDLDGGDCTDPFDNCRIFETEPDDPFEGSGNEFVPVFVAGVRLASGSFSLGGEARWQKGEGDLPPGTFFGSKIDLTGWTWQGTIGVRF